MVTSGSPVTGYVQEMPVLRRSGQQGDYPQGKAFETGLGATSWSSLHLKQQRDGRRTPGEGLREAGPRGRGSGRRGGASKGEPRRAQAELGRPLQARTPPPSLSGPGSRTGVPRPRWGQGEGKRGASATTATLRASASSHFVPCLRLLWPRAGPGPVSPGSVHLNACVFVFFEKWGTWQGPAGVLGRHSGRP